MPQRRDLLDSIMRRNEKRANVAHILDRARDEAHVFDMFGKAFYRYTLVDAAIRYVIAICLVLSLKLIALFKGICCVCIIARPF